MNALALVIGNGNYILKKNVLPNAARDAESIAKKLMSLGFTVEKVTDCTEDELNDAMDRFKHNLKNYHVGLFYFAGHGLQIKGHNYLTTIDTDFKDKAVAKRSSIDLDEILEAMDEYKSSEKAMNIIILDACRNNPYNNSSRNAASEGLAPVPVPKGTIIAFSTSPGQTADDGRPGGNSMYAQAFLTHLEAENIPIEDFFKRVRTSVYSSTNGVQTSWEHTSLIGSFAFNSPKLTHTTKSPYSNNAISDKDFESDGTAFHDVIENFRIYDFNTQANAIGSFKRMQNIGTGNKDSLFLIGRNILQAAVGGVYKAEDFMANLTYWLSDMFTGNDNHVFNGILFEMYFNSYGRFRKTNFKNKYLNEIFSLETEKRYTSSFKFIAKQLKPFRKHLLFLPGDISVPIEIMTEKYELHLRQSKIEIVAKLTSIKYQEFELFSIWPENHINDEFNDRIKKDSLKDIISKNLMIPIGKLTISFDNEYQDERIEIPLDIQIALEE